MGLLSIDSLAEGMILKSDVSDRSGRMLLGSGTELCAKHLRMFQAWGITEADVDGVGEQDGRTVSAPAVDPAILSAAESELHSLFCNADLSYPPMGELYRLCLLRKVQHETR